MALDLVLTGHGSCSILVSGLAVGLSLLAVGQEQPRHVRAMDARLHEERLKEV